MKYGLIGEKLSHSFSVEVHSLIGKYDYELIEKSPEEFDSFIEKREFLGINITIPYKLTVLPHLDFISDTAKKIGAVNTVVNKDGKLYGYNTDFYGLSDLILRSGVRVKGKKCAILGSGGTARTARFVLEALGALEILSVSRDKKDGYIDYSELYESHGDVEIIINATPVGMYPKNGVSPVEVSRFKNLKLAVDAIYNPINTRFVQEAREMGAVAVDGLYMLVAQGVRAACIFTGEKYKRAKTEKIYKRLLSEKENVVLIGMPASGKSTVGALLSERLSRKFIDTDELIEKRAGVTIKEIFEKQGEEYFRSLESEVVREVSREHSLVISTGGGAVLRRENVKMLRENGKLFFLDRDPERLTPTDSRPTAPDRAAIMKRYEERYEIYKKAADFRVSSNKTPIAALKIILKEL